MKSLIIFLVLLSTYCYCERILGGWSKSSDDNLHRDCLNRALAHIHGDRINDEIRSLASDLSCQTQIVNGLNIKCQFILRNQKWHCTYYKSFVQTLETQLEQCKIIKNEEAVPELKEDKPANEELEEVNEGRKEEQSEMSDEDKVEEQPAPANEDKVEEQPASANEDEKKKQVGEESLIADQTEEDDEAKIDAINQQRFEQNANHEEEQQA